MKKRIVILSDNNYMREEAMKAASKAIGITVQEMMSKSEPMGISAHELIIAGDLFDDRQINFDMPIEIKARADSEYNFDKPLLEEEVDLSFYHKIGNQKSNRNKRRNFNK